MGVLAITMQWSVPPIGEDLTSGSASFSTARIWSEDSDPANIPAS